MPSRYDKRRIALNKNDLYKNFFKERGVRFVKQYMTPNLKHPTSDELSSLDSVGHIWIAGDRFYKLAHEFYGDSELWWVIAWFNQKPTEAHIVQGETIYIPLPLTKVLQFLDV